MADNNSNPPLRFSASSVAVAGTTWTANVMFSSTVIAGQTAIDMPEWVVSMPWPLAKALIDVLKQTVDQYEKVEGTINLPTSYTQKRAELESK